MVFGVLASSEGALAAIPLLAPSALIFDVGAVAWSLFGYLPWKRSTTKSRLQIICNEFVEARPPPLSPGFLTALCEYLRSTR